MYSILSIFTKLQQKFTYRQRFVFFALIFFVAIPYPTYWLLRRQSDMLRRAHHQENGLAQQQALSSLVTESVALLTALTVAPASVDEALLSATQRAMAEVTRRLKALADTPAPSLINGDIPPAVSEAERLYGAVDHFITLKTPDQAALFLLDVIDIAVRQTRYLAMDSGLFFQATAAGEALALATYELLPQDLYALASLLTWQGSPRADALKALRRHAALETLTVNGALLQPFYAKRLYDLRQRPLPPDEVAKATLLYQHYHKAVREVTKDISSLHDDAQQEAPPLLLYHLLEALKYNQLLRTQNLFINDMVLLAQKNTVSWQRTITLTLLAAMMLLIAAFVTFRLLTRHLTALQDHIEALAQGDFTPRSYPHADDAFAQVGLTLNDMANSLSDLSAKIHRLGLILADSSEYLTYDIRNHELSLKEQSKNIASGEKTAQIINENCRIHAAILSELGSKAIQEPLTKRTHEALALMQESLTCLATNSHMTLLTLQEVEASVQHAMRVSEPFREVSEKAHLLALSSAIEQHHCSTLQETVKITRSIQRFSSATAEALHMILDLFFGTSQEIKVAKETIANSLEDIYQGTERLRSVNNGLSLITQQARRQLTKFEELHNVMQIEAIESESIIEAIHQLQKNSHEIIDMFNGLSVRVQHLGIAAQQLKTLLRGFGRYVEE